MTRLAAALGAILVLAGCGSASTPAASHHTSPSPRPSSSSTWTALDKQSYTDGEAAGKANYTTATSDAACRSLAATVMRQGDIESEWVYGCFAGAMLGQIKADQSGNG